MASDGKEVASRGFLGYNGEEKSGSSDTGMVVVMTSREVATPMVKMMDWV